MNSGPKHIVSANGLPVFSYHLPGTRSLAAMISFPAGAHAEDEGQEGLAHLAEHLVFKGNDLYPENIDIARAAEDMGARINAQTSHSSVSFFIQGHGSQAEGMIDLLAHSLSKASFREGDIEQEKLVIKEEISQMEDSPSFRLTEATMRALYGDHPLARPVIGNLHSINAMTREDLLTFRQDFWSPERGGLFLAGDTRNIRSGEIEECLSLLPAGGQDIALKNLPGDKEAFLLVEESDANQTQLRFIWRLSDQPLSKRERMALAVYNTILGGTMSSLLFQELREKRSLCYDVSSSGVSSQYGAGLIISLALSPEKVEETLPLVYDLVLSKNISAEDIARAKRYLVSNWALSLESSSHVASSAAALYLTYGDESDPAGVLDDIAQVTQEDISSVLEWIHDKPSLALLGPHREKDFFS